MVCSDLLAHKRHTKHPPFYMFAFVRRLLFLAPRTQHFLKSRKANKNASNNSRFLGPCIYTDLEKQKNRILGFELYSLASQVNSSLVSSA